MLQINAIKLNRIADAYRHIHTLTNRACLTTTARRHRCTLTHTHSHGMITTITRGFHIQQWQHQYHKYKHVTISSRTYTERVTGDRKGMATHSYNTQNTETAAVAASSPAATFTVTGLNAVSTDTSPAAGTASSSSPLTGLNDNTATDTLISVDSSVLTNTATTTSQSIHSYSLSEAWEAASSVAFSHANDHWLPVQAVQCLLDTVHLYAGVPWWASIVISTLAIRALMFPLAIFQARNGARMTLARPELEKLANTFKQKQQSLEGLTRADRIEFVRKRKELFTKYRARPAKMLIMPLAMTPIFLSFFAAIRSMHELYPSFQWGGLLHVTDLSAHDPFYFTLPLLNAITMLIPMELLPDRYSIHPADLQRTRKIFRVIAAVFVVLGAQFPSGLFVFWISSNLWTIVQHILLRNDMVRKWAGLPDLSVMEAHVNSQPSMFDQFVSLGTSSREAVAAAKKGQQPTASDAGYMDQSGIPLTVKDAYKQRNANIPPPSTAPGIQIPRVLQQKGKDKKPTAK